MRPTQPNPRAHAEMFFASARLEGERHGGAGDTHPSDRKMGHHGRAGEGCLPIFLAQRRKNARSISTSPAQEASPRVCRRAILSEPEASRCRLSVSFKSTSGQVRPALSRTRERGRERRRAIGGGGGGRFTPIGVHTPLALLQQRAAAGSASDTPRTIFTAVHTQAQTSVKTTTTLGRPLRVLADRSID